MDSVVSDRPAPAPDIDLLVRFEQVRELYGNILASTFGTVMGLIGCLFLFDRLVDPLTLTLWGLGGVATVLCGVALYIWHHMALRGLGARGPDHVSYLVYVAMSGVLWGAAGWLFFFPDALPYTLCLIAGFCAFFGATIVVASSYIPAVMLFFLLVGAPLFVRMVSEQQFVWSALAAFGVIYVAVLAIVARRQNRSLLETWRLGFLQRQNQAELRRSYEQLETRVQERTAALRDINRKLQDEVAERRRAEQALKLTQSRLSDAVESMDGALALYDANDVLVLCNTTYRAFIPFAFDGEERRWTFRELVAERIRRGRIPAAVGREAQWLEDRMAQHRNARGTDEHMEAGGRWYRIVEHRTADGGIVAMAIDITEAKAREAALARQSDYLDAILKSVSQGVCLFDSDRRVVAVNERFREMIELPPALSRPGARLRDIILHNARNGRLGDGPIEELVWRQEAMFSTEVATREERTRADGLVLEMVSNPTGDGGFVVTFTDITAYKHREQLARENEERFRAIVEAIPIPVAVLRDSDGLVMFENSLLGPLYDLGAGEMTGRKSREFFSDIDQLREIMTRLQVEGHVVDFECAGLRPDGSVFPAQLSAKTTVYQGVPATVAGVIDLTERRQTEERLRQAQKMEAVGQLTGGVAHDFNNLLAIIVGCLELATESAEPAGDLDQLVRRALYAAERGATLTQRLLAFSRRQPLDPRVIDLNDLLESMSELIARALGETIEIEITRSSRLWLCKADPTQLENAVLNLAINARDAMPEGGRLTLEVDPTSVRAGDQAGDVPAGDYVVLRVADTGVGMTEAVASRATEPFFTTKETGAGSGLGLSMVYGFVRQSGGYLDIDSAPDAGTRVSIYLPRVAGEVFVPEDAVARLPSRGHGETVLLVEDDDHVRQLIVDQLASLNYETVDVGTGAEALDALKNGTAVDLVFSDIVLPGGMSGVDLAREIRAIRPDMPVAFMSGYAPASIRENGAGADLKWLEKPFHKEQLASYLRQALDRTHP